MKTPFKMKGKSPMMKALIGNQNRLPAELKAKILASPATLKKGATSNARSKTPGPIVADTRVSRKKKTSKSIGPSESPKAIAAKRDKMRSAEPFSKAEETASAELRKAKSFAKMKKAPAKMAKKSPAKATTKEVVVKGGKAGKSLAQRDYAKNLDKKASEAYMKDRSSRTGGTDFATADEKTKAKYRAKASKKPPTKLKKSPTKQTANRDKPKTSLTDKIKKGTKAVSKVAKKATKKLVTASPAGRLVSKASKYLAKRKKAKTGANAAGTAAKTVGALAKSNKKAKQSGKAAVSSAAELLSEKITLRNLKRGLDVQVSKKRNIKRKLQTKLSGVTESKPAKPSRPSVEKMARTEAAKPKLTLNQKNKARKDKQKKFLKK